MAGKNQESNDDGRSRETGTSGAELEQRALLTVGKMKRLIEQASTSVMSERLRSVLRIPPLERSRKDNFQVYAGLTALQVFDRIPECNDRVASELSRVVSLEVFPKVNASVIDQGEAGDAFYVVVSGSVRVWIVDGDGRECTLATRSAGDVFGEVALIMDAPRTCSVTTDVPNTELLSVSKSDYLRILRPAMDRELREKMTFMKQMPLFQDLSEQQLSGIAERLPRRRFRANELIAKQGDISTEAYIVFKGCCSVFQRIQVSKKMLQPMGFRSGLNDFGSADIVPNGKVGAVNDDLMAVLRPHSQQSSKPKGRVPDATTRSLRRSGSDVQRAAAAMAVKEWRGDDDGKDNVVVHVRDIWRGDLVGEFSLLQRAERTASLVASTATEIFVISKSDLFKIFPSSVITKLQERAKHFRADSLNPAALTNHLCWGEYKACVVNDVVAQPRLEKQTQLRG